MKKLLRGVVVIATAAGVGYVVYKEVLSDEAKENINKMVDTVKTSYERINEVFNSVRGDVMPDDEPLPNVQTTMRQWKDLGY
ncbi:hypothetical protein [Tractidigestivibacter scatoligenes]|jgi:hypothetical protein|uniref:hypothetical protein n=1 Tax=Tractidigestivibacter scatoligenes TaxID=1299998 RepID=UPI002F3501FB